MRKFIFLALLAGVNPANASFSPSSFSLDGSARLSQRYFNDQNREDTDLTTAWLWLDSDIQLDDFSKLTFNGWLKSNNNDSEVFTTSSGQLNEAYYQFFGETTNITIGKQIIIWGRADSINPTDNISPRDYTLFVPEDTEQRSGVEAINVKFARDDLDITVIAISNFTPSIYPIRPLPGVALTERKPDDFQGAVKINSVSESYDWSLSYFDGYDLTPQLSIQMNPEGPSLLKEYDRVRIIGADGAATFGRFGVRGELAYSDFDEEDLLNPVPKSSNLYLVAGLDHTFFENFNVNVQYFHRHNYDWDDPRKMSPSPIRIAALASAALANQLSEKVDGFSLRLANSWLHETLTTEVVSVYNLTEEDFYTKLRATYAINDEIKLTLGADQFHGDEQSYFGSIEFASSWFIEMKYSF